MSSLPLTYWCFLTALAVGSVLGVGALVGGDAEVDADADADTDAYTDTDADGAGTAVLAALGVGRLPLGALLSISALLFGSSGVVASELLSPVVGKAMAGWIALPSALVLSLVLGGRLAAWVARRLPAIESYGATRNDLVGRIGRAELAVDARFGRALVRDDGGALHQVRCVTRGAPVERGGEVVVIDFDAASNVYTVERADLLENNQGGLRT
jgi:hypothetical protein